MALHSQTHEEHAVTTNIPHSPTDATLADLVGMATRSFSDRVAIEVIGDNPETLTYGQMWERALALAEAVQVVEPGHSGRFVSLLLDNGVDALVSYLACQLAGVAAVPVNNRLSPNEVRYAVEDSGSRLVLVDEGNAHTAARAIEDLDDVATIRAEDVPASPTADVPPTPAAGDDPAAVFYTSGTTGFPKGAVMSNATWFLNSMRWGWDLGVGSNTVMLVPGPLFHMSYSSFALATFMKGGRVRIMRDFDSELAYEEFTERCTIAFLVPAMTTMLAELYRSNGGKPMPALRQMMTAGAAVSSDLLELAFDMFPDAEIAEVYGWTEGGFATREIKTRETVHDGTVGWPVPGCELVVLDDDGKPVPRGERGEVGVRSIAHFSGYLNRPEATEDAFIDGAVMSGDIGVVGEDGRLRIVDRKKAMIITGGENVYATEVEMAVVRHPAVREVAVIGVDDDRWGELVTAVCVLEDGVSLDLDELRAHTRQLIADYKCPRKLVVVNELPRNSMGKLQKFLVADLVEHAESEAGTHA